MLVGDPDQWLSRFRDVEQRLIERCQAVWPTCTQGLPRQPLENAITRRLVLSLKRDPEARSLGAIHSQMELLDEQLKGDVVPKGYIDMAVVLGGDPDCYVAFECKRLRVPKTNGVASLASEYVEKGMQRYVRVQYALELPLGAMIGYVLDGNIVRAEQQLRAAIADRADILCLSTDPVTNEPIGVIHRLMTGHMRAGDLSEFEVRHSLLPFPPP